jgi:hypothetical protein
MLQLVGATGATNLRGIGEKSRSPTFLVVRHECERTRNNIYLRGKVLTCVGEFRTCYRNPSAAPFRHQQDSNPHAGRV